MLAVAIVGLGWAWWMFAPPQLGGDATYVMTRGISMEPLFHTGDLAIVKPAPSYHVGEIVAYRAPIVGVTLHRIIADNNGHFTMKGDNNDFTDPFHPTARQVVGRLWMHIPKVGVVIPFFKKPAVVAIAVGLLAMILFGLGFENRTRRTRGDRRRRRLARMAAGSSGGAPGDSGGVAGDLGCVPASPAREPATTAIAAASGRRSGRKEVIPVRRSSTPPPGGTSSARPAKAAKARSQSQVPALSLLGPVGQTVATLAAIVALIALGVGAMALMTPVRYMTTRSVPYTEQGTFSYQAPALGSVYSSGSVHTGEPVFLRLSSTVYVGFTGQLTSKAPALVQGTESMDAIVSRSDGWHTTLPLVASRPFTGVAPTMTGALSIPAVESAINSFLGATQPVTAGAGAVGAGSAQQNTFAGSGGTYNVAVVAHVQMSGTLGKQSFTQSFAPQLGFQLNPTELQMVAGSGPGGSAGSSPLAAGSSGAGAAGAAAGSAPAGQVSASNPAQSSLTGQVSVPAVATRDLRLPFVHPSVPSARAGALAGLLAAALLVLALYAFARIASRKDEARRIRARYGPFIVSVSANSLRPSESIVTVGTIDDLIRVADGEGRMVLHEAKGLIDDYYVQTEDITYHYQAVRREREPRAARGAAQRPDERRPDERDAAAAGRLGLTGLGPAAGASGDGAVTGGGLGPAAGVSGDGAAGALQAAGGDSCDDDAGAAGTVVQNGHAVAASEG